MILEVIQLKKHFGGITAVNGVSFGLGEAEISSIIGPNGAGKTTTVRILACLISASEGSAIVGGYEIGRDSPSD